MNFVSISMNDIVPSWRNDLISEVVSVLHQLCRGHVLVAFPKMTSGEQSNLGSEIRLFAKADNLVALFDHTEFRAIVQSVQQLGGFVSIPLPIPVTTEYRIYLRDRRADRQSPSRQRRHIKRGGASHPVGILNPDRLPYIRIISNSTGKRNLSVFIREEEVNAVVNSPDGVNTYGLSTSERRSAVPHF